MPGKSKSNVDIAKWYEHEKKKRYYPGLGVLQSLMLPCKRKEKKK